METSGGTPQGDRVSPSFNPPPNGYSNRTSIYFPKDIHEALVRWAEEEDRPISNLVVRLVSKAVEEREKKQNPPQ
ncbi:ribbon-helix-helix domain-containing protein [Nostoc sp. 'Lobaria pulmonaria (5183) cyanobiont']|uniref:ribbon-helix-helix domain-containing protein n=1 Tax=Nostoc sp. 'Lobaria pulmonaria (5183) cyanobiont' TaxID=1618022 RepID=UPI000D0C39FE|nr:hypothetical protein [Nostoc sp. 'Lobaria pulmonaria (5183) cyanobiont']AVH74132.1 hypothetical protein NLP_5873 [Nostoc sp. 'Lobaria pulmonaria (5183) cyanobiont']